LRIVDGRGREEDLKRGGAEEEKKDFLTAKAQRTPRNAKEEIFLLGRW
jgi:hypothetical protein